MAEVCFMNITSVIAHQIPALCLFYFITIHRVIKEESKIRVKVEPVMGEIKLIFDHITIPC